MDPQAAKQFLISKVTEQAALEHLPLSDIERKMLYFSEVQSSLPDMYEVNAEFEKDYDSDEYEAKVSALLVRARGRDQKASVVQGQIWSEAIESLRKEDHYILVMAYCAFPEYRKKLKPTHRIRDYFIYVAIGIALVLAAIGWAEWRR